MTKNEFNIKYFDYLDSGHYGCDINNEEAINYLDSKFKEYIKLPNFKYQQIKSKWNYFCFYASGITPKEREDVEMELFKLCPR